MAYYKISGERLKGFADQARRLSAVTGELTPEQIEETLSWIETGLTEEEAQAMVEAAIANLKLQSKTVTPTDAEQTITADEGYFGLASVIVEKMKASGGKSLDGLCYLVVSSNYLGAGGILEDTTPPPPPGTYYNGVKLPEIPDDVLVEYPICWIRLNSDGSTYDLICGKYIWYAVGSTLYISTTSAYVWYTATASAEAWTYKTSYTDDGAFNVTNEYIWSSHDILNGHAAATEIYLKGSEPVIVE